MVVLVSTKEESNKLEKISSESYARWGISEVLWPTTHEMIGDAPDTSIFFDFLSC